MVTGKHQFSVWTGKKLQSTSQSQTQTCTKNGHDHCLVVCCLSDPLQLCELLCLRSMLSKSMRCKCKPQFSTEWAQFCTKMPDCRSQNHFKNEMNWAMKFCFICHIHLTSCQQTHFFKHLDKFLQGKCFHNQ